MSHPHVRHTSLATRLLRQPQNVWIRRALFQIHLWTGIGVGLYVLMISITGSAIVYRREITRLAWTVPAVVPTGPLMSVEALSAVVKKANPRFDVVSVKLSDKPDRAAQVVMSRGQRRRERVFDPYTGKDLGDVATTEPWLLYKTVQLHDDLLGGRTGRLVNGVGALLFTALCITGAVIWWPGTARWKRSLMLHRKVGWQRFNWDLHSVMGFWVFAFLFIWAISGLYLSFPEPFSNFVDYIQPPNPDDVKVRSGDEFLAWLARIHFGRAWGNSVKALYTTLGLVPAVLFITGGVMWWNRVVKPALRRSGQPATESLASEAPTVQTSDFELES